MITENNKMVDLVHRNYSLIPVLERFGIVLGFGDKTIREVCDEQDLNIPFFLEIINSYLDDDYFPREHLITFPLKLIVDYLTHTHRDYLEKRIPEIEAIISDSKDPCYEDKEHNFLLIKFFREYKNELILHIRREDEKVFPYTLRVEEFYLDPAGAKSLPREITEYSIMDYLREHDDIEEKLFDLKNILIKYLPPPRKPDACYRVIAMLCDLEKDMNDHSRIEEKVLVPKVAMMEKTLRKRYDNKPSQT
jgi:regulator of cell morphogenesis and NO signaling